VRLYRIKEKCLKTDLKYVNGSPDEFLVIQPLKQTRTLAVSGKRYESYQLFIGDIQLSQVIQILILSSVRPIMMLDVGTLVVICNIGDERATAL